MSAAFKLGPEETLLLRFVVAGGPVPLARARMGPHGWYTPEDSRRYKTRVARNATMEIVDPWDPHEVWNTTKARPREVIERVYSEPAVEIWADLYFADRRRKDIDNVQKAIADALVDAKVIRDDSWSVLRAWKVRSDFDRLNPRAEIEIHRAEPPRDERRRR